MYVTLSGITILVKLEHPPNVVSSILWSPSGRIISVNELQSLNASAPMLLTLFGIVMFVNLLQPQKTP